MATQASSGAPRVLVVDDEAMLADLLSQALRHEGWETATAKDGLDALAKASSFRPDVVILDVQMPGMDGFQAASFTYVPLAWRLRRATPFWAWVM